LTSGQFWIALLGAAQRLIFHNPLEQKDLMDCIALAHTHRLPRELSTLFLPEGGHFEKEPVH
jgi:hypothetical protein